MVFCWAEVPCEVRCKWYSFGVEVPCEVRYKWYSFGLKFLVR